MATIHNGDAHNLLQFCIVHNKYHSLFSPYSVFEMKINQTVCLYFSFIYSELLFDKEITKLNDITFQIHLLVCVLDRTSDNWRVIWLNPLWKPL